MLHFAFAELIMKTRLKVNEYVHDIKNRIPEFKVMHKSQRTFKKTLLNGVLVLIYYFKKPIKSCFFDSKDILKHFKFENWRIGEFDF